MIENSNPLTMEEIPLVKRMARKIMKTNQQYSTEYDAIFDVLYDDLPEDKKADIINGEIILHCPVMPIQDVTLSWVRTVLWEFIKTNKIEALVLGDKTILKYPKPLGRLRTHGREPDLMFINREQKHLLDGAKFSGVPPLIIEILGHQKENQERDLIYKAEEYALLGVHEYWVLNVEDLDACQFGVLQETEYQWNSWPVQLPHRIYSFILDGFYLDREWLKSQDGIGLDRWKTPLFEKIEQRAEQEKQRAEQEKQRAEQAVRLLLKNGIRDTEIINNVQGITQEDINRIRLLNPT